MKMRLIISLLVLCLALFLSIAQAGDLAENMTGNMSSENVNMTGTSGDTSDNVTLICFTIGNNTGVTGIENMTSMENMSMQNDSSMKNASSMKKSASSMQKKTLKTGK